MEEEERRMWVNKVKKEKKEMKGREESKVQGEERKPGKQKWKERK